jgi:hypothetical protein
MKDLGAIDLAAWGFEPHPAQSRRAVEDFPADHQLDVEW